MREPLHIAVCEDSSEERLRLCHRIAGCDPDTDCACFSDGEHFLQSYWPGRYDLIFMDIYLGGLSGVEAVSAVRRAGDAVPVAFTTSSTDFALEGYRLDVLKYLEKPVQEKPLRDMLAFARLQCESRARVTFRENGAEQTLMIDRILYVEQKSHALLIYLTGGGFVRVGGRLDSAEPLFAGHHFFRCHKSYLVNLAYVCRLDRELMVFEMREGQNVHIRRESLGAARRAYEDYLFDRTREAEHA